MRSSSPILLTGATGFIGRYLMRDLLLRGVSLLVLGRSRGPISGEDRIEAILQDWEHRLGRRLLRPIFLEGRIHEEGLGLTLSPNQQRLIQKAKAVIHCAASLRFEEDDEGEEPLRTNLLGTQNVVRFALDWGIPHFHHVSTAYVCGRRQGAILESELDVEQDFHNIYEQSKFQAEQWVRSSQGFESRTIYRPSIVVGDSKTGFSSTFHTVYSILRFLRALPEKNAGNLDWIFQRLKLSGDEGKNLVPVDWVSHAIVELLDRPQAWNQTYHLTNRRPTTSKELSDAIAEAIEMERLDWEAMALPESITDAQAAYQTHVDVYRGYLANDPIFDTSNLDEWLPAHPEPTLDHQRLVRLFAFAIKHRFRDPTPAIPRKPGSRRISKRLNELSELSGDRVAADPIAAGIIEPIGWQLRLSGNGGGIWNFGPSAPQQPSALAPWVHSTTDVWNQLIAEEKSVEQLLRAIEDHIVMGNLLIVGSAIERKQLKEQMAAIVSAARTLAADEPHHEAGERPMVLPIHTKQEGRRFA